MRHLPFDVWELIFLNIPYLSLSKLGKINRLFRRVLQSSSFWHKKSCLDLKRKIRKEFFEDLKDKRPRFKYLRVLAYFDIFYPGSERFVSPFQIIDRSFKKDARLIRSMIKLIKEDVGGQISGLSDELIQKGYLKEYLKLVEISGDLSSLEYLYSGLYDREEIRETEEKLRKITPSENYAKEIGNVRLLGSIIAGSYKIEKLDRILNVVKPHVLDKVMEYAVFYERQDLIDLMEEGYSLKYNDWMIQKFIRNIACSHNTSCHHNTSCNQNLVLLEDYLKKISNEGTIRPNIGVAYALGEMFDFSLALPGRHAWIGPELDLRTRFELQLLIFQILKKYCLLSDAFIYCTFVKTRHNSLLFSYLLENYEIGDDFVEDYSQLICEKLFYDFRGFLQVAHLFAENESSQEEIAGYASSSLFPDEVRRYLKGELTILNPEE